MSDARTELFGNRNLEDEIKTLRKHLASSRAVVAQKNRRIDELCEQIEQLEKRLYRDNRD